MAVSKDTTAETSSPRITSVRLVFTSVAATRPRSASGKLCALSPAAGAVLGLMRLGIASYGFADRSAFAALDTAASMKAGATATFRSHAFSTADAKSPGDPS